MKKERRKIGRTKKEAPKEIEKIKWLKRQSVGKECAQVAHSDQVVSAREAVHACECLFL